MSSRICVKNIGKNCTEQQLRDTFSKKGEVTDVKVLKKSKNGVSRNFAFIGFRTELQAQEAIKYFNNTFIGLSRISVEMARKLDDASLKEKREKFQQKNNSPSTSPKQLTNKKSTSAQKETPVQEKKPVIGKNKQAFLDVTKKTSSTMAEKSEALHPVVEEEPEEPAVKESTTHSDSENESDNDDDDESMVDLDDLLLQQRLSSAKSKTTNNNVSTTIVEEKPSQKKLTDLDFLRSKMQKAFSDSEDEDEEEEDEDVEKEEAEQSKSSKSKAEKETKNERNDEKLALDNEEENDVMEVDEEETPGEGKNTEEDTEIDEHRIFIKNIPYSCTEDELRELGQKYGKVSEVHIPIDSTTRRNKGIGFITFLFPSDAQRALDTLHGSSFQGRVMYITAAKKLKEKEISVINVGKDGRPLSSFQQKKEEERRKLLHVKEGWNASYVRSDAVIDNLAERYNVAKSTLLDTELKGGDIAVRLAVAETQIIQENKAFFSSHGVNLDILESANSKNNQSTQRSSTTLLIKNLPPETDVDELESMFTRYGVVSAFLVPKSKTLALVEFEVPTEARLAHKSLAYRRYKNSPLFLEWAPLGVIENPAAARKEKKETEQVPSSSAAATSLPTEEDDLQEYSTLFVKNLNFTTTEEAFIEFLTKKLHLEGVRKVIIQKKQKGNALLSQGYGFVEFRNNQFAEMALNKFNQGVLLDSHKLDVKPSDKRITTLPTTFSLQELQKMQANKQPPKLIVRNVAFQASKEEIRNLFTSFGSVKRVRIPKKMDGTHRGFAFVEFSTTQEAINAMNALKNTHLYGRHLVIEWAKIGEDGEEDDEEMVQPRQSMKGASNAVAIPVIEGQANKGVEKLRKRAREDEKKMMIAAKKQKKKDDGEADDMNIEGEGTMKDLL